MAAPAPRIHPSPTYRVRRSAGSRGQAFALLEEHSQRTLASCDVARRVATSELEVLAGGARFTLVPNRRVLPTRWTLSDGAEGSAVHFDAEVARKLLQPLTRTALVIHDGRGAEPLRLVDQTSSTAERMLGVSGGDWSLLRADRTVATLTRLPPPHDGSTGVLGWLRARLASSERALVSFGDAHVLSPAAALALVLLFNELTDNPS